MGTVMHVELRAYGHADSTVYTRRNSREKFGERLIFSVHAPVSYIGGRCEGGGRIAEWLQYRQPACT